jgi:hypothetical protein
MSRLAASCSFQRSTTPFCLGARGRAGNLPFRVDGNVEAALAPTRPARNG